MSTHPHPPGPWRLTLVTNPDDCNLACPMCGGALELREGDRASPEFPRPTERNRGGGGEAAPGADDDAGAGRRRRMDPAFAERVVREAAAAGVREVIPSTMGEPLLWAGLDRLVGVCAELRLGLNLTTNGTFPGRGAAAWAERLVPVAVDVKVSWNAATAGTAAALMPGLDLARAIDAVRTFVAVRDRRAAPSRAPVRGTKGVTAAPARVDPRERARARALARLPSGSDSGSDSGSIRSGGAIRARACRVSFQVTAQEGNVAELGAIVRLAASLGVERVKVNQLQVRAPALAGLSLRRSAAALGRWNAAVKEMRAAAAEARLASGGRVLLENVAPFGPDPAAPAPSGPCRFVGREAWVHPDGAFAPCPSPAALRGELGAFGSLAASSFAEVWSGEALRALVAAWEEHPTCRRCPFRTPGGA